MISSQVMIKVIQIVGLSIPRPGKIKRLIPSNSVSDQKCRNFNHPGPCSEVVGVLRQIMVGLHNNVATKDQLIPATPIYGNSTRNE